MKIKPNFRFYSKIANDISFLEYNFDVILLSCRR